MEKGRLQIYMSTGRALDGTTFLRIGQTTWSDHLVRPFGQTDRRIPSNFAKRSPGQTIWSDLVVVPIPGGEIRRISQCRTINFR
jgi:hypothetical protein